MKNLKAIKGGQSEMHRKDCPSSGATADQAERESGKSGILLFTLTRLPNHASSPGTVVVHLPHTSLDLATMVRPFRLPVLTITAPYRQSITSARVHIASVEGLEAQLRFERHEARIKRYCIKSASIANKH